MANKKVQTIFLLLSLTALALIGWDYVCGHMGESPLKPTECPLCLAFQSTEFGQLLSLSLIIIFGIFPITGFVVTDCTCNPTLIYITTFSLRAPPHL